MLPRPWRVLFSLLVLSSSSFPRSDVSLPVKGKKKIQRLACSPLHQFMDTVAKTISKSDLPRTKPGMQKTDRKTRQTEAVLDLHQTWPLLWRTKEANKS